MNRVKFPREGARRTVRTFAANADMRFDEAVLAESTAAKISGFDVNSGALTDGYGVEESEEFGNRTGRTVWQFIRYDREAGEYKTHNMFCDVNGYVHVDLGNGFESLGTVNFADVPSAVKYRLYGEDSLIMTSGKDRMFVWDGVSDYAERVLRSPYITSMTMHYERMFATTAGESNAVYFSDDLDPTNWNDSSLTEGGYIMLLDERGKLLKVVDFLNYVYIFREYGISRLTAYADQTEFGVVNLYVGGGRIYEGSVCPCGDTVMMLASDGLYSFDGYDVTRRLKAVRFAPSPNASGVFSDGKYYLAANTTEGGENDTLVVYDMAGGTFSLSRLNIKRLCKLGSEVFAIMSDNRIGKVTKCAAVFGTPLEKYWESGELDFSTPSVKTLGSVSVRSDGNASLTVTADGKSRTFGLKSGMNMIKPMLGGRTFKFRIESTEPGARIRRLSYRVRGG